LGVTGRNGVSVPLPLPGGLLAHLAAENPIALFLDYDGTLSEITPDIASAGPVAGASELIARLAARRDRFVVAIVSGRQIDQLIRRLGVAGALTMVGNHGLEIMEPDGRRRLIADPRQFMPSLDRVRSWLSENVSAGSGFVVEDKRFSVALHYRFADPALAQTIRGRFSEFVQAQTPELSIRTGKMVIEALPRQVDKGRIVRMLTDAAGRRHLPVCFGDDDTDEDAFYALREDGVTVRVCDPPCASWAKYRVASPQEVIAALTEMAAAPAPPSGT
jgi:trehalose-phosphatase